MTINKIINSLILYDHDKEWVYICYKGIDSLSLGEMISALSNSAALNKKEYGYLILGIDPLTFKAVGTDFNPSKRYLAKTYKKTIEKYLKPKINVRFDMFYEENNRRVVILYISSAKEIPTSFKNKKYLMAGKIKTELKFYPKKLNDLYRLLNSKEETLVTKKSIHNDLTFNKLFYIYSFNNIELNKNTFLKDLNLLTEKKEYNYLGELLSDTPKIYIDISLYKGRSKTSQLIINKEFKHNNLLYLLNRTIDYIDSINFSYVDSLYNFTPLFDDELFKNAITFAFLNNSWSKGENIELNIFSNRIEIISKGLMLDSLSIKDLINGEFNILNKELYLILAELGYIDPNISLLSEINNKYGINSFKTIGNNLIITIPFNQFNSKKSDVNQNLSLLEKVILDEIRNNNDVTIKELMFKTNKSKSWVERNIKFLKEKGYLARVGSKKTGGWREVV